MKIVSEDSHVRSRCRNRAYVEILVSRTISRSGRCPILGYRASHKSFSTQSGFLFTQASRTVPAHNACAPQRRITKRAESTVGGKPAYFKSVHQRTQIAILDGATSKFSDWLRLNLWIVKNAYASSERNDDNAQLTPNRVYCVRSI